MKAWLLNVVHGSLQEADVEHPTPGPGQVLVKVRASGLCHSDVGYMEGVIPIEIPFPASLGHEASGTIEALGEGVTGWNVGDAVASAIPPTTHRASRATAPTPSTSSSRPRGSSTFPRASTGARQRQRPTPASPPTPASSSSAKSRRATALASSASAGSA